MEINIAYIVVFITGLIAGFFIFKSNSKKPKLTPFKVGETVKVKRKKPNFGNPLKPYQYTYEDYRTENSGLFTTSNTIENSKKVVT